MAPIFRESTVVVVAVVRTRPRAIPLAMIAMSMVLRLAALRAAGAPL